MMYGGSDAATAMGAPSRRPSRPRADLRFKGWNDAADAASSAINYVGTALGAERFATIDPEEFYDFQATRPRVKMVEGQTREIVWPAVELFEARVPRAPRDLILLTGSEPSFRWRTFCQIVVELAEALGAQLVVTLGALLADVPHTRPVSVTGPELRPGARGSARPRAVLLRGPDRDRRASCTPPASRRACPRPACGPPCRTTSPPRRTPRRRSRSCASSRVWSASPSTARTSRSASADYERQVNVAVQSDPDVQAFVERLEQAASEEADDSPSALPSGETIARDLQRFLRQRGGETPPSP